MCWDLNVIDYEYDGGRARGGLIPIPGENMTQGPIPYSMKK